MAGLSRKLNLSERDINLKEALQKLDAPGIENDIELFSLSSQVNSLINSGTESQSNPSAQLIALSSQTFKTKINNLDQVVKRTKFITKDYSFATGNKVFFDTYTLGVGGDAEAYGPIYSENGSIPQIRVTNSGAGYFFRKTNSQGEVANLTSNLTVQGVVLEGEKSGATNSIATIEFAIDPAIYATANVTTYRLNGTDYGAGSPANNIFGTGHDFQMNANGTWTYTADSGSSPLSTNVLVRVTFANNVVKEYILVTPQQSSENQSGTLLLPPTNAPAELLAYTGFYTRRFKIASITLTSRGTGYILGERLLVKEGVVTNTSGNVALYLEKQQDYLYSGDNPNIFVTNYLYDVVKGGPDGFYLYDSLESKYIFLDKEKDETQFNEGVEDRQIRIARFDGVDVRNIFNLRFSGSAVALEEYTERYRLGDQIVGEINELQNLAARLTSDAELSIQNTRLPLTETDARNDLGFEFNRFVGVSAKFRQRLILRDQDWVLNPNNAWITEAKLKTAFGDGRRFEILHNSVKRRAPGIFIKVGTEYKRAFSTKDKPFLTINAGGNITNPDLSTTYAVSAQDVDSGGTTYAFNTEVATLGQRIQPVSLGTANNESHFLGADGAFYFHKQNAPSVSTVVRPAQGGSGNINTYLVPLFRYLP
ncbi:virion structural protein [Cyanophage S-TIM66]|nr:virion structural protein [Cyanophage S-TIM66]